MGNHTRVTYDHAMLLKAAGLIAATATEATILDLGPGYMQGDVIIDVSALEVASTDEVYTIALEGSNVAGMGSDSVILATKVMGNVPAPADADSGLGRHKMPFDNEFEGEIYRYVRLHTTVAGAIATGINYSAFLAKHQ